MLCPLCNQECISTEEAKGVLPPTFRCPTQVRTGGDGGRYSVQSHFTRYSTGGWSTGLYYLESAIILPYKLENHYNDNVTESRKVDEDEFTKIFHKPHSSIFVMGPNPRYRSGMRDVNKTSFNHVLKLPLIHMDIEEKLKERIKLILLLS